MDFELRLSPRWSSTRRQARQLIRRSLNKRTGDPKTLNPKNYHRHDQGYFSISHTRGLGGYLLAPVPSGFDLEPQNREVSQAAYKRFTSLRERRLGLTPLEAWVAKEAAFKALSAQYPIKTITEVQLFKPRKLRPKKILEFSFKYNKNNSLRSNGRGFLMTYDRFLLGFASISP